MRRVLQIAFAVLFALCTITGCTYDPAFDLTCEKEGRIERDEGERNGRICQDGIWVLHTEDIGTDAGADVRDDGDVSFADTDTFDTDTTDMSDADTRRDTNDADDASDTDGCQETMWFLDADDDGYGTALTSKRACDHPDDGNTYVLNDADCNDDDPAINPDGTETCDGVDQDCDGDVDEGVMTTYYADMDADGFGDGDSMQQACDAPSDYVADDTDCDDTDPNIYPGAPEACNMVDDDCDGDVDEPEDITYRDYFVDGDGDGFGAPGNSVNDCKPPGNGYAPNDTDCDDSDPNVHPNASEVCNGIDDNCSGTPDDGLTFQTYYHDGDGDGYGDPNDTQNACQQPADFVLDDQDCDDGDPNVNPSESEVCNGIDDDCAGGIDDGLTFVDYYADNDGDGFGDPNDTVSDCQQPAGYVTDNTDCDDNPADGDLANPDGSEIFFDQTGTLVDQCGDTLDNDCNGDVDGADWACQNRDSGDDTSPNGIDPIFTMDANGDGNHETLCIVSAYVMPDGVWQTSDAIYQGDEGTQTNRWGGYDVLDTSQVDTYDATDGVWCHDFTGESSAGGSVSYIYRYVSTLLDDGQTAATEQNYCTGGVIMDVTDYCTSYSDPYCKTVFSTDGCNDSISWVVRILWDGTEISD